jgi:hypothetical protein
MKQVTSGGYLLASITINPTYTNFLISLALIVAATLIEYLFKVMSPTAKKNYNKIVKWWKFKGKRLWAFVRKHPPLV